MPLRDHFHSPLDDLHSWDGLHGGWPMMMVRELITVLPDRYFAVPGVHLGTVFEVDVGTYDDLTNEMNDREIDDADGRIAIYAPPQPTLTLRPQLRDQDVYEVRVYDSERNRKLVAAIEIVSPSNKDRPNNRATFVAKVESLLRQDICVSIVDVVSNSGFNLYAELLDSFGANDPAMGFPPPALYVATIRTRRTGQGRVLEMWYHSLTIGQTLPTLPIWLNPRQAVSLNLETSYEETCRSLRIR